MTGGTWGHTCLLLAQTHRGISPLPPRSLPGPQVPLLSRWGDRLWTHTQAGVFPETGGQVIGGPGGSATRPPPTPALPC